MNSCNMEENRDPANFTFFKERAEHRTSKEDVVNVSSLVKREQQLILPNANQRPLLDSRFKLSEKSAPT
jgi:hypothetical protein